MVLSEPNVEYLVVDTTAFIQNAPLQTIGKHIVTCQDVVDEITNKRQLRRLVVLPYDLEIKHVFPENIQVITEFSKRTGDYQSLSATDIKVMALTYQLEKENVGLDHLKNEPVMPCTVTVETHRSTTMLDADVTGFYVPGHKGKSKEESILSNESEKEETNIKSQVKDVENGKQQSNDLQKQLLNKFETLQCSDEHYDNEKDLDNILQPITESVVEENLSNSDEDEDCAGSNSEAEGDDDVGWITPSNIQKAKKQINSKIMEEKSVKVACVTTDFAMQNVLKQINLNVSALDGRIIKQLRTFILRCYSCFGTTSIMTKLFCPKCGNKTLKRVAVSLDEDGKQQIHINGKHPLTARGKKFSLPRIKGGKHSNNPRLVEDQPMPDQRPTRLARTKTDPLDDDYIAGYSPFVMRDVTSKSAQLKIRPATEVKNWMRKSPNEVLHGKRK